MTNKIFIISGATATGKSELALKLGQKKEIGIINADSLQIYQGLPILSAQPSDLQKTQIPHFLYSHLKPNQHCSVGLWLKLIEPIIKNLWESNRIPVIVGGTGLYISKLIDGISEIPEIENSHKQKASKLYKELGPEEFKKRFGEEKISDKNRLIRACEVFLQTKKPLSFWQKLPPKKLFPSAEIIHFNLNLNREKIYQNCNLRFKKMLEVGAINEVENFIASHNYCQMGLNKKNEDNFRLSFDSLDNKEANRDFGLGQITKTLGFFEIASYLQKEISLELMTQIASQKTRNYAKRQLTWFRHQFEQIIFCENEQEFFQNLANL